MFSLLLSFTFAMTLSDGADHVINTAYQSCDAAAKPAMTTRTPALEGVAKTGQHENGIGDKFEVVDLLAVQNTHYYIKDFTPRPACFDVLENPLIYDYGGKPFTSAALDSKLNLFRNAGSGTSALGIDCSGFVFSSLAVSGHKLHPKKELKASQVHNVNAAMYMDPEANNLLCFERIKLGKSATLKAGDIIASKYHVGIVHSVGKDPFGIESISWEEDCDRISTYDFNFILAHSGPNKGALGIQKIQANAFIPGNFFFNAGMLDYARATCRARLQNSNVKPSSWFAHVIRHKKTPECMGLPLELEGTECLNGCSSRNLTNP